MALHAVDDLTDAFAATKSLLWPFEWGTWWRLAVLSLFVAGSSGGGGGTVPQYTFGGDGGVPPTGPGMGDVGAQLGQFLQVNLGAIIAVVGVLVLLGLAFAWLGAVFEFALLESLRRREVRLREYTRRFTGAGTRLFGFRVLFGLLGALVVGALAFLAIGPAMLGLDPSYLLGLVVLAPLFFLVGVLASVVYVFTTAFVAPIMLLEDRGVIDGWRRLWGVMRGNWAQFGVFVLVGLFVMIGVGIVVGIAVAVLAVVIAIPFGIVFLALTLAGIPAFNVLAAVVLGVPFALLMLALVAFAQVPVQTFLRYWALLILGDVDPDLDLIPEQRAAVRE